MPLIPVLPLLSALILAAPPAPAMAPRLTVSKVTNLASEEWITVLGEGFAPALTGVVVGQCPSTATSEDDCNIDLGMQDASTDASGRFGPVPLRVLATFHDTDCRISACVIMVLPPPDAGDSAPLAVVPITFATGAAGSTLSTPVSTASSPASGVAAAPSASAPAIAPRAPRLDLVWIGVACLTGLLVLAAIIGIRRRSTA